MLTRQFSSVLAGWLFLATSACVSAGETLPSGWTYHSPREELQPLFSWNDKGGYNGAGELIIRSDQREGLNGCWRTTVPVVGGQWYNFAVARQTIGMALPRRAAVVEITWLDDQNKQVARREPTFTSYRPGERPTAEPEFPLQGTSLHGWTWFEGTYEVPPSAKSARIDLHFRWGEPRSEVHWSMPQLVRTDRPKQRVVRLASVHYQPRAGKTPREKCEQFAPLIAEAAEKKVDLVVLPETLTYFGTGGKYADVAEPVPGPSTEYFGQLAKKHQLHIVAGLIERDGHLIYNVAVLIGPDGEIIGNYRKVTLPRGEIEGGITPGNEYPVFQTSIGKIGMMVCYDGFFPEVARELSNRGAEIIAWPVWGCNPMLAQSRACENHIFLISSTFTDYSANWMLSAVYGRDGSVLSKATDWGSLAISEVNLDQPTYWHSLGDFRAQIQAHRPEVKPLP